MDKLLNQEQIEVYIIEEYRELGLYSAKELAAFIQAQKEEAESKYWKLRLVAEELVQNGADPTGSLEDALEDINNV